MKEEINPVPKQSLLILDEVSILLSSYNDISSAFDPNESAERTLCRTLDATANFELTACNKH